MPSYLVVTFFAYIYERTRAENEDMVKKRTESLNLEIEKGKIREIALQESEQRYRAVFDSTGDAINIVARDGTFLEVNREGCERSGYSRSELLTMRLEDICTPEVLESAKRLMKGVKLNQQEWFESEYISREGVVVPAEVISRRIVFDDQPAIINVARDISRRKAAEEEKEVLRNKLLRAQKMEAIGLMAGGVAHDLNNLLAGIVGYPQLLLNKLPPDSNLKPSLMAIQDSGNRAANIVADLLTVARGAASTRETSNMNILVSEYLDSPEGRNLQNLNPQITWTLELDTDLRDISCSVLHINKCLMNLTINAAEAVTATGQITITTQNILVDKILAEQLAITSGSYIVLRVTDTGQGVSAQDINHIFEPFYSKKEMGRSGTGLGLAVVWNTVQDHEGKITVESCQNGTIFSLYFPVTEATYPMTDKKNKEIPVVGSGEKILIVDDEQQLRDLATQMLEGQGFNTFSVDSGEQALEYLQCNAVDLVVLDMCMEPGMSGREAYSEIIKIVPNQKAIITSGYSDSDDIKVTMEMGVGNFIKKPYSLEQLGQAVHAELNR